MNQDPEPKSGLAQTPHRLARGQSLRRARKFQVPPMLRHRRCRPAPAWWSEQPLQQNHGEASQPCTDEELETPAASARNGFGLRQPLIFFTPPNHCCRTRLFGCIWQVHLFVICKGYIIFRRPTHLSHRCPHMRCRSSFASLLAADRDGSSTPSSSASSPSISLMWKKTSSAAPSPTSNTGDGITFRQTLTVYLWGGGPFGVSPAATYIHSTRVDAGAISVP